MLKKIIDVLKIIKMSKDLFSKKKDSSKEKNGGVIGQELNGILDFVEKLAKFKTEQPFLYNSVKWFIWIAFFFVFSGNIKEIAEAIVILGEFFSPVFKGLFAFYGKVLESFGFITLKEKTLVTLAGLIGCVIVKVIKDFFRNQFKK